MTSTRHIDIKGMHCAACSSRVEEQLRTLVGVSDVSVNLITNSAVVTLSGSVRDEDLSHAVAEAGYTAEAVYEERISSSQATAERLDVPIEEYQTALRIALPATALVMTISMLPMVVSEVHHALHPHLQLVNVLCLVLSTTVLYAGRRFFQGAVNAARHRTATMDTLISIGTAAAWFLSAVVTVDPQSLPFLADHIGAYYDTTCTIITLVLVGKFLESRAKKRTSESLLALMQLHPTHARVVRDGKDVDVPLRDVHVNDVLLVRQGENVPVDGIIISGHATVDESMLTGESIPAERYVGATITGGTQIVSGTLTMTATAVGSDTVLSRIIAAVEAAQSSKAPIQRLADKISAVFVPIVLVLSALTYAVWMIAASDAYSHDQALVSAIAVLIIACPCALGLATPAAVIVSSGVGARNGILFSSAEAIEQLAAVHTVVVDKTGTVTEGRPTVQSVTYVDACPVDLHRLQSAVASIERVSEHPLAAAIVSWARAQGADTHEAISVTTIPGRGVSGLVDKLRVRIGNQLFMEDSLLLIPPSLLEASQEFGRAGNTTVFVSINGVVCCAIAVADSIRSTSMEAIRELRALGISVGMLTGDRELPANAVAKLAGIETVHHSLTPAEKLAVIETMQRRGAIVCMIGDGVNDAPALAQADVGIALGSGTDVAKSTANITLMRNDLRDAASAIRLAKRTMQIIRQNFVFAFIYNILGIPLAAGALLPLLGIQLTPMFAAAAMALSSVTVLSNALRLRTWR
ncbi:MAG: hypothetical protein RLZZ273_190 [Bacteroidota bacterium]